VGSVLGNEEISGNDQKADQGNICTGGKKSALLLVAVMRHAMPLRFHIGDFISRVRALRIFRNFP
jgi:hypothetical protein